MICNPTVENIRIFNPITSYFTFYRVTPLTFNFYFLIFNCTPCLLFFFHLNKGYFKRIENPDI